MAKTIVPVLPYTVTGNKIAFGNGVDKWDFTLNPGPITGHGWQISGGNGADVIAGSIYNDIIWGDSLGHDFGQRCRYPARR